MMEKLTEKEVRRRGCGTYGDGLWLRVVTQDRRYWLFRYQRQGKVREMGLPPFRRGKRHRRRASCSPTASTLSISDATKKAAE